MSTRDTARVGSIAGWMLLFGILAFGVIGPTIVAGQRVSGTSDPELIRTYYSHPGLEVFTLLGFPIIAIAVVFVFGLRECVSTDARGRFLGTLGLLLFLVEAPLLIAEMALQGTLVTVTRAGGDPLALFRFWDVLYNSGAYALEAGMILCLSLATRDVAGFPPWLPRFGVAAAVLQLINMTAIFAGIPDQVTLVGNVTFSIWIATMAISLGRIARSALLALEPSVAPG
jgi:hypothetical protein